MNEAEEIEKRVKSYYEFVVPRNTKKKRETLTVELLKSIAKQENLTVSEVNLSLEDVKNIINTSCSYKFISQ